MQVAIQELPPVSIKEGDRIDGKYVVESILGRGAMGIVCAARHEPLDMPVAIKVVVAGGMNDREATLRFYREARLVARFESEHVARVTDAGQLASGEPYMVMERLVGSDLATLLEQAGPLQPAEAVDGILQVLDAVAEAHGRGIVHRDLKPANIFRATRADGTTTFKVLDFGISKAKQSGAVSLTGTQTMMGSPGYMAPEQIMATREVDARADVWSLGVVLFELLVGKCPFGGDTVGVVLQEVLEKAIPEVRTHRPDVPPALSAVVSRCMSRKAEDRYADVGELAVALAPFASARAVALVERILRHAGSAPATVRGFELAHPSADAGADRPTMSLRSPSLASGATVLAAPTREAFDATGTTVAAMPPGRSIPPWALAILCAVLLASGVAIGLVAK